MKTITYDENEWQLVPKISTSKMDDAGKDAYKENGHCDCGNYDGCSMEEVYSSMLAVAPAAQDSAPAELPIKTWQERLREKFPETADRNLFAVGHLEHAMEAEIADLRAALSRPVVAIPEGYKLVPMDPTDEMYNAACRAFHAWRYTTTTQPNFTHKDSYRAMLAAAPASPQPVAKVLPMDLILATAARFIKNESTDDGREWRCHNREIIEFGNAIFDLAASTPTTLTEKKE